MQTMPPSSSRLLMPWAIGLFLALKCDLQDGKVSMDDSHAGRQNPNKEGINGLGLERKLLVVLLLHL